MTAIVERVSLLTIDHRDVEKVLAALAKQPSGDRDLDGRMLTMLRTLPGRSADYLLAIEWRLAALARLHESHPNLGGFARPDYEEGASQLSPGAMRAACRCRLIEVDKYTLTFDPEEFNRLALEAWDPEGSA